MSNNNSPEYRTIIQCTPELTTALKDDLLPLSGELLAAGLIADDNAAALTNPFNGAAARAAQLMGFVRNRVSLDTKNYVSFIRVLQLRQDDHKNILDILNKKYKELEGGHGGAATVSPQTSSDSLRNDINSQPTLAELSLLQTPKGKVQIIKKMSVDWRGLGALMDFDSDGTQIDIIGKKHPNDPKECCRALFQYWLDGNGVKPCSWRKLIELIHYRDEGALAQEIQSAFSA